MHDLDRTQIELASDPFGSRHHGTALSEDEQMSLAAELMEVSSEDEFEDFLGDLISKGAQAVGSFINSPTGQALGGVLKGAAKQILPIAGQALGAALGGPAGAQIGGQLGSGASGLFEAEAEMEEREWEAANTFLELAADAIKNVASAPPGADPGVVAHSAVVEAAKVHAPALVPALSNSAPHRIKALSGSGASGRWVRRGNRIILHGV